MTKKTKKIFALCVIFTLLLTSVLFQITASASTALGGADRYATALKIVQNGWTKSDNVIIARGDDLADALAAAPLAYAKGKAPILLTSPNKLPAGVLNQLKSMGVKNVYIIGGTIAVSKTVEEALEKSNFKVIRIAGKNRTETSYKVAIEAFGTIPNEVVIANGLAYADALAISSVAAVRGMPILLVVNNKLSADVASCIANKTVYAVGGTMVLSEDVVTKANATRLSGKNRYETNAAILKKFPQNYNKIYLAKGTTANLVDALAGSALAALGNNPIILVDENSAISENLEKIITANISNTSTEILLGGTVSNSAGVAVEAMKDLMVTSIK
jgi:putative cell wall-binding protein